MTLAERFIDVGAGIVVFMLICMLTATTVAEAQGLQAILDGKAEYVYSIVADPAYLRGAWHDLQAAHRTGRYRGNLHHGNGQGVARSYSGLVYPFIWHYEKYRDQASLNRIAWILDTAAQAHDGWIDANGKRHVPTWGYSDDSITLYNLAYGAAYIGGNEKIKRLLISEADALVAEIDWVWAHPRATPRGPTEPDGLGPWAYHRYYWEHEGPYNIHNGNLPANKMIALDMMYSSQEVVWDGWPFPDCYHVSKYHDFWTVDTKAEECAWKTQFLAKVYSMYPDHETAADWLRIAKTCAFLALSTDESYTDDIGHTWTHAKTVDEDLAIHNHGWSPNHNYACSVLYSLLQAQEAMISAGLDVPWEFKHRIAGNVHSKFYKANFTDGWHNNPERVPVQEREAYEAEMKRGYPSDYRHLIGPFYLWQYSLGVDVPEADLYAYLGKLSEWTPEDHSLGTMVESYAQHAAKRAVLRRPTTNPKAMPSATPKASY